jgi:putative SOS response-associated peptidase YedK
LLFAGFWTRWTGIRRPKGAPFEGERQLFGFPTTTANAIVAPIRAKATPMILKTPDEVDVWLSAETKDAVELQRPLPDGALKLS